MTPRRLASTAVAGVLACTVSSATHAWAMPLPVVDPAAIARATDALESADQMLASYTHMLATWTRINTTLDSGMLGLVARFGLPEGLDPASALGALLGVQLPYEHLAGGLLDITAMHPSLASLVLRELNSTILDPAVRGLLPPDTIRIVDDLYAIGALDTLTRQNPNAVAGFAIEVLHGTPIPDALKALPSNPSTTALRPILARLDSAPGGLLDDLAQRIAEGDSPQDALRAATWNRREILAATIDTMHRARPSAAAALRNASDHDPSTLADAALARAHAASRTSSPEPWLTASAIPGWQHQIRTAALADPVRAQLGTASHAAHDALLLTDPTIADAHDALRTNTPAPPGGSNTWHGAVHLARSERSRVHAEPRPTPATGTPHAPLQERIATLTANADIDARAHATITEAISLGLFDGDVPLDDERNGIARSGPASHLWANALPGDRRAVLDATTTHTATNAPHIARALSALRNAHQSTPSRIERWLALLAPAMVPTSGSTPHNPHGLAPIDPSAIDAILDRLPVGLSARARSHCLPLPGCLWPRGGRLGPPRAHPTQAAMHARSNDLLGSALAEGRNVHHLNRKDATPNIAPSHTELTMRTDSLRHTAIATARAETGCATNLPPNSSHGPFDDDPHIPPPIATPMGSSTPATSPTDLLYLSDARARNAPELRRIEAARAAFERNIALDTWSSAVATVTHDERRLRQHHAMRERFSQCPDLLCELRTYVDIQRLNAQSAQQRLHTGLRHLELAIATDLRHQRTGRP